VTAGGEHACAIDGEKEVQCWGNVPESGEHTLAQSGFSVEGVAWNYGQFDWAEAGKCVHVTDPTPILTGSPPLVLSSASIAAGGAFRVNNVETVAELGLFMTVDDCEESSTDIRTATGIGVREYEELGDGDTLGKRLVLVIDAATAAGFDQSLDLVGYTGEPLATTGGIFGFVVDTAGVHLDGATVGCEDSSPSCPTVYYMDSDATDGLFGAGGVANVATQGAAEAVFLIPDADLTTYAASHVDFTFSPEFFGHTGGLVAVLQFMGR
jgi:hypothetical protein